MSNTNQTIKDNSGGGESSPSSSGEREHAGNSGEGAASALAQLKTQTKQHRRQIGDGDDPSDGPGQ
jgi:hypothetical protein